MNLAQLEKKIISSSQAYYDGNPIISDSEFDELIEQLKQIDPNNPILTSTGWGAKVQNGHLIERKHEFHVGGLPKFKSVDVDLVSLPENTIITSKLDGISAVAYYHEGKLKYVLTRGDGETGLDITNNLQFAKIPKELEVSWNGWVRGEIVIKLGLAEKFGYSTERNMSAGLCNTSEIEEGHKYLEFVAYDTSEGISALVNEAFLDGFKLVRGHTLDSRISYLTIQNEYDYTQFEINYDYLVDGVVIQEPGKDKYAVKYPNKLYDAEVVRVVNQISSRGRVIPVIQIKPVKIDGVNIEFCSGFNYQSIKQNKIGPGALIKIKRANEVIPHWEMTVKSGEYLEPEFVEIEDQRLPVKWNGVHLEVQKDKSMDSLKTLISWKSPKGFANAKIEEFIEVFRIRSYDDLYELIKTWELKIEDSIISYSQLEFKLNNHFSKTYQPYVCELLNNMSKGWTLSEGLQSTFTRALGEVASDMISEQYNHNYEKLYSKLLCEDENTVIENLKTPTYLTKKGIKENLDLILDVLRSGLLTNKPTPKVDTSKLLPICLTGKLSKPRGKLLEEWSDKVYETDISKAKYLVTDNPNSGSSKNEKAKKLGVTVISESDFTKLLKGE